MEGYPVANSRQPFNPLLLFLRILDVLIWCRKLTDASLKVIAETCSGLCALGLFNLRKLTDSALGYLANGCQEIHTLKLCRNAFRFLNTIGI